MPSREVWVSIAVATMLGATGVACTADQRQLGDTSSTSGAASGDGIGDGASSSPSTSKSSAPAPDDHAESAAAPAVSCTSMQAAQCTLNKPRCKNALCSDGICSYVNCYSGQVCIDGTCESGCTIGGTAYASGQVNPSNACQVCNPSVSTSAWTNQANGTTCSDGNPCTTSDQCTSGACGGTVTNGASCGTGQVCNGSSCSSGCFIGGAFYASGAANPSNACQVCTPATSTTAWSSATNGTACNDGNACTQTDTCQSGVCTGSNPVVCTAQDQCHIAGTCNTSTGACSNPAAANGTACNDGNACTQTDTCQSGVCTGSNPVVCTAQDQCHVAGTCNTSTGVCSNPAAANGTACNDGNACTQTDTCQSGVCNGSNPVVCTAQDQCHVAGTCNTSTGACSNPAAANGTACNDGNACTQTDTCQSGACTGSNPVVCTAQDQCHVAGTCDTGTGACSNPMAPQGTACNDGNACTQIDMCQSGVCTGSNPVVCTAQDQCHVAGTCDTGTGACSNPAAADGTACNDGNACTQTDTCQSGVCNGSNPVTCPAPQNACHGGTSGTCDPSTGACAPVPQGPVLYADSTHESPVRGGPGDLLLLPGSGFNANTTVVYERVPDTTQTVAPPSPLPTGADADAGVMNPITVDPDAGANGVTVRLPAEMIAGQSYALWAVDSSSSPPLLSNPIKINDARPMWLSPGPITVVPWATDTRYVAGELVTSNGNLYENLDAGLSGDASPSGDAGSNSDGSDTWKYISPAPTMSPYMYTTAQRPGIGRTVKIMGRNLAPLPGHQTYVRFTPPPGSGLPTQTIAANASCTGGGAPGAACTSATDCCSGVCNAMTCAATAVQDYAAAVVLPTMPLNNGPTNYTITVSRDAPDPSGSAGSWVPLATQLLVLPDPPPLTTANTFSPSAFTDDANACDPCDTADDTLCITRAIQAASLYFQSTGAFGNVVFPTKVCANGNPSTWTVAATCYPGGYVTGGQLTDTPPAQYNIPTYDVCPGFGLASSGIIVPFGVNLLADYVATRCATAQDCVNAFGSGTCQAGVCAQVVTQHACPNGDSDCTAFGAGAGAPSTCSAGFCTATMKPIIETEPTYDDPVSAYYRGLSTCGAVGNTCNPANGNADCCSSGIAQQCLPHTGKCEWRLPGDSGGWATQWLFTLQGMNVVQGLHLRDHDIQQYSVEASAGAGAATVVQQSAPSGGGLLVRGNDVTIADSFLDNTVYGITVDSDPGLTLLPDGTAGNADLVFTGNTIAAYWGTQIAIGAAEDSVIAGNTLWPGGFLDPTGYDGMIGMSAGGAHRVEISSNNFDGEKSAYSAPYVGWRSAAFFPSGGSHEDLLLANNKVSCSGARPFVDGEAFGFDENGNQHGFRSGQSVLSATCSSVTVPWPGRLANQGTWVGRWLQVDYGTGLGQARRIVGPEPTPGPSSITFNVSPPFDVAPDDTSTVLVSNQFWQMHFVDNLIDNSCSVNASFDLSNTHWRNAGVIGLAGSAVDSVVESNTSINTAGIAAYTYYFDIINRTCTQDGAAPTPTAPCCSGDSKDGACVANTTNPRCVEAGQACATDSDCCSKSCDYGVCSTDSGFSNQFKLYFIDIRGNTIRGQWGGDTFSWSYTPMALKPESGSGIYLVGDSSVRIDGEAVLTPNPNWLGFGVSVSYNTVASALTGLGNFANRSASIAIGPDTLGDMSPAPGYVDTLVFNNVLYGSAAGATYTNPAAIWDGADPGSGPDDNYPTGTLVCSNTRNGNTSSLVYQYSAGTPSLFQCACIADGSPCTADPLCCSGYCVSGSCSTPTVAGQ